MASLGLEGLIVASIERVGSEMIYIAINNDYDRHDKISRNVVIELMME